MFYPLVLARVSLQNTKQLFLPTNVISYHHRAFFLSAKDTVLLVISLLFPPAAVHIIAHLFNFEFFMDAQLNRNSSYLPFILSEIGTGDNASFLNPIRTNETVKYLTFFFFLVSGI